MLSGRVRLAGAGAPETAGSGTATPATGLDCGGQPVSPPPTRLDRPGRRPTPPSRRGPSRSDGLERRTLQGERCPHTRNGPRADRLQAPVRRLRAHPRCERFGHLSTALPRTAIQKARVRICSPRDRHKRPREAVPDLALAGGRRVRPRRAHLAPAHFSQRLLVVRRAR